MNAAVVREGIPDLHIDNRSTPLIVLVESAEIEKEAHRADTRRTVQAQV
jgi:hypothetical protein